MCISPAAKNYLPPVRDALFDEDYKKSGFACAADAGTFYRILCAAGQLYLVADAAGPASECSRALGLWRAIAKITYTVNGTVYIREVFASCPDQVIVIRLTAKGKDKLNFTCRFDSKKSP